MKGSKIEFTATGTRWQIDFNRVHGEKRYKFLESAIKNRIDDFENVYSRFRANSFVSRSSNTTGIFQLPDDSKDLYDFYFQLNKLSDGRFTPLIGETLTVAGYDSEHTFVQKQALQKPTSLNSSLIYTFPKLEIKKPVVFDFGAAGKGYIVDIVRNLLLSLGETDFCIDAGGDIWYQSNGNNTLRVGLENPQDPEEVIGVIELSLGSICGSSGNRREWGKFHHIINPDTLTSPVEIISTWVVAKSTMVADGIATSLFFTNPEKLRSSFEFEFLILNRDFSVKKSDNFPAELFIKV